MKIIDLIRKKLMNMSKYISYLRTKGVEIGNDCEIHKSANFGSEPYLISLGNHVRINAGVQLITHDGGMWVLRSKYSGFGDKYKNADKFGKIEIGNNVHIGTNATIMPGVTIGENCIIACNAVVTHDVPSGTVVGGVPAKLIETIEEYEKKNKEKIVNSKHMTYEEKKEYLLKKDGLKK